ncbi:hypothetical protein UT300009_30490 [Paraclostridium bifermentans]
MSNLKNTMMKKIIEGLESSFDKPISEITREELSDHINNNYVVGYTYFTVSTRMKYINAVLQMYGNENTFTVKDFGIVMKDGKNLSVEEIQEYIGTLDNPQDKFIIYALFCGIYNQNAEELLTITTDMIDLENGIISLKDRDVVMDSIMKVIVEKTLNETTYYILDTGKTWRTTEFRFNPNSPYLIKQRPSSKNHNGEDCMSYNGFRTRMKNLLEYLDSDLSITDIVRSGYAYRIYKEVDSISTQSINAWLKKNNIRCSDYKLRKTIEELYQKSN